MFYSRAQIQISLPAQQNTFEKIDQQNLFPRYYATNSNIRITAWHSYRSGVSITRKDDLFQLLKPK